MFSLPWEFRISMFGAGPLKATVTSFRLGSKGICQLLTSPCWWSVESKWTLEDCTASSTHFNTYGKRSTEWVKPYISTHMAKKQLKSNVCVYISVYIYNVNATHMVLRCTWPLGLTPRLEVCTTPDIFQNQTQTLSNNTTCIHIITNVAPTV